MDEERSALTALGRKRLLVAWLIFAYGTSALLGLYALWPTDWWPWPQLLG